MNLSLQPIKKELKSNVFPYFLSTNENAALRSGIFIYIRFKSEISFSVR